MILHHDSPQTLTTEAFLLSSHAQLSDQVHDCLIPCKRIEPVHEISNNVVCATSKASDQPAHMGSLIRAFVSRLRTHFFIRFFTSLGL